MYVGKRDDAANPEQSLDNKTGAAAVVRNLKIVLANGRLPKHVVVIDRFYSSVPLAIELLAMSVYVVGTVMTNRLGFDRAVIEKRQTRPLAIERGSFSFSRSVAVPSMVAFHWWDRKSVHYLCTGVVMTESTINRNIKRVGKITVPCPSAVNDYQRWMGGVDIHDQLRLQSYSLQTSIRVLKYYISIFLGILELALVNSYIAHCEAAKINRTKAMGRAQWFSMLQNQLFQLKAEDFVGVVATPSPGRRARQRNKAAAHALLQFDDWVTVSGVQKRRQRSCKVCALLRGERKKSFQTTFYCEKCSVDDAKCYLCPKARHEVKGVMKTCFQIWHEDFEEGKMIPATLGKRVVLRRARAETGPRKKTRRELNLDAQNDAEAGRAAEDQGIVDNGDSDFE